MAGADQCGSPKSRRQVGSACANCESGYAVARCAHPRNFRRVKAGGDDLKPPEEHGPKLWKELRQASSASRSVSPQVAETVEVVGCTMGGSKLLLTGVSRSAWRDGCTLSIRSIGMDCDHMKHCNDIRFSSFAPSGRGHVRHDEDEDRLRRISSSRRPRQSALPRL